MTLTLRLDTAPPADRSLRCLALDRVVAAGGGPGLLAVAVPGAVRVLDAASLAERWSRAVEGAAHAVAISTDGQRLAVAVAHRVEVHGPGALTGSFAVPGGASCLAFDAGGRLVAGSPSAATWVELGDGWGSFTTHARRVLAVDRAGDVVLSGGADAQVACTDLSAGRAELFQGHVGAVRAVRLLPGGDALSASVDGTVRRWRGAGGEVVWVARPPGGAPASLAVDRERVLVGGEGGLVSVLDVGTGALAGVLPGHSRRVVAVGPAVDGRLWSVAQDRTARTWHREEAGPMPPLLGHVGGVRACLLDGSGAWSGGRDGTVRRWDPDTGRETARWGLGPSAVQALARLGDGGLLVGGADGQLRCLAGDGRVRWSRAPAHQGPVTSVAVMADDTVLSGGADGVLRAWASGDGAPLWAGAWHQDRLRCLALGSDGRVATGGYDGQVLLGEPLVGGVTPLHAHHGPVVGVARCGQAVVSGGLDGALRVHHLAGPALRDAAHLDGVVGVRALDAGRVATVGRDGFVRLWRVPDLAPLGALDLGVPLDGLGGGPDTLVVGDRRGGVHLLAVGP